MFFYITHSRRCLCAANATTVLQIVTRASLGEGPGGGKMEGTNRSSQLSQDYRTNPSFQASSQKKNCFSQIFSCLCSSLIWSSLGSNLRNKVISLWGWTTHCYLTSYSCLTLLLNPPAIVDLSVLG